MVDKPVKVRKSRRARAHRRIKPRKRSIAGIAGKKISRRKKANWHAGQILKELKKKKPNWRAVRYHRGQELYHALSR